MDAERKEPIEEIYIAGRLFWSSADDWVARGMREMRKEMRKIEKANKKKCHLPHQDNSPHP